MQRTLIPMTILNNRKLCTEYKYHEISSSRMPVCKKESAAPRPSSLLPLAAGPEKKEPAGFLPTGLFSSDLCLSGPVKLRIDRVKIPAIQIILNHPQRLSKPLEVGDLPLAQKLNRLPYVRNVDQPQDVVVGGPRLLLRRQILKQIGDRVPLGLEDGGGKRRARGRLRPNAAGVVHKVGVKARPLHIVNRHVAGQLPDDRGDHLHMP